MKKKLIILAVMSLGIVTAAYAGYASSDENVLPTDYALNYKGSGDLAVGTEYGYCGGSTCTGCGHPWDEYATCYFGYEAVGTVYYEYQGVRGAFDACDNKYMPSLILYGGSTQEEANSMRYELGRMNINPCGTGTPHSTSWSIKDITYRYICFRFKREGSATCGTAKVNYVKATRIDAFSFYDGSAKLNDGATVNLSVGVEKALTISLYAVKHLPVKEDVTVEIMAESENNPLDYIAIDNCTFNSFSDDYEKSGYYNLNSSTANMKVKFPQSGVYKIYVNVKYKGLIVQRRYLNFDVSDN